MFRKAVSTDALFIAALITCCGCGQSRPETAPVSGKVTFQGKPVAEGRVMFYPKHGRPAIGTIGPDGTYRLTTFEPGDGAMPGHYVVTIEATHVSGVRQPKSLEDETSGQGMFSGTPKITWLVPQKYSERGTTTLKAEVKPGENTIDFDLP